MGLLCWSMKVHPTEKTKGVDDCKSPGNPSFDIVYVNQSAVQKRTDNQQNLVDIPIVVTAWEGAMDQSKNKEERKRLMSKLSSASAEGSDVELSDFLSDTEHDDVSKRKFLSKKKLDEDDGELQSLSSLEDEQPTFASSKLVITKHSGTKKAKQEGETAVLTNPYSLHTRNEVGNDEGDSEAIKVSTEEGSNGNTSHTSRETDQETKSTSVNVNNTLEIDNGFHTPTQSRSRSISNTSEEHEAIELLPKHTVPQNVREEGQVTNAMDNDDDNKSDTSEFRGSLGIDVDTGDWFSDINVQLDLQLGRDEWETKLPEVEGEATLEDWETTILDIADSKASKEDWTTSFQDISNLNHKEDREKWSSVLPEKFVNTETPRHWSTKITEIEKIDQSGNRWSTFFNKIRENVTNKNEWKTKFNTIGKNTVNKDEWTFKLPNEFTSRASKRDWRTKINKTGDVTSSLDKWKYRSSEMLVTSDDRTTQWNTAFKDIEKHVENINEWKSRLSKISPLFEEGTWSFHFADCSDDIGSPEDWDVKFIDIEKNENEDLNWSIKMNDVPDSYREVEDWETSFKDIEEVDAQENRWDTKFNDILPNGDESALWTNKFLTTDITDMNRETWESSFNDILPNENTELDWEVSVNAIEPLVT